jgi:hypothetical protein
MIPGHTYDEHLVFALKSDVTKKKLGKPLPGHRLRKLSTLRINPLLVIFFGPTSHFMREYNLLLL